MSAMENDPTITFAVLMLIATIIAVIKVALVVWAGVKIVGWIRRSI